jgi:hypothetical protein
MKALMITGGGLMTAVVAVPLLALLAVFGVAGTALGCPPGGCPNGEPISAARGAPRSPAEAIRGGLALVGTPTGWYQLCDRLVCRTYGYANSGHPTAVAHWTALLAAGLAHPGDRCPPPGSFVFWTTGPGEPGHVALVTSADRTCAPHGITVVSNDVLDAVTGSPGGIYHVTLARLEAGFVDRARYLGWTQPVCSGLPLPTDPVVN